MLRTSIGRSACLLAAVAGVSPVFAQLPCADHDEANCPPVGCGKASMLARRHAAGFLDDEPLLTPAEALSATDLQNVNLSIEVFPSNNSLAGTAVLTIRALAPINQFTFRLRSNFTITSSTVSAGTPVSVAQASTTTRVATLDRTYNAGETFTLTIVYNGVVASRGFGSIEYQTTPFGDPIIASLSEAFYAYTWWPSKEGDVGEPGDMSDKATFQIAITAPDNLTSVSNGLLQGVDTLSGNRKRFRWASSYPQAVYLAFFGTSVYNHYTLNYTIPSGGGATMPVEVYLYPGDDNPANRAQWDLALQALDVYGSIYGPYPFMNEKYGMYQFPFGGGMEHQTFTGMGVFIDYVTVHELAHQWWGDNVTCKTWSDIWLNEGFATYSEALWEERKPGSSGLPALFSAMASRRPGAVDGTVYRYDVSSNNPIFSGTYTYRKGGWVLHMLRHVVGDSTFFNILQTYRAAFQGSAATTDDFKSIASSVSGQDLTTFFQQWVYLGGAPAYAYGFQPITVNGKNYVKVRIRQTQDPSFGVGGLFDMPVDLRLDTASGSITRTVRDNALNDHFVLPAAAPVTGVALDEFDWILTTAKTGEAYVAGAPVLVETIPAPGASVAFASAPTAVDCFFSDNVTASASAFTLTGPSGPVPFTFSYSAPLQRARLSLASPLSAGSYILAIGTGVSTAAGALDGEVAAGILPSGDGAAGGTSVITFSVQAPTCVPDFNHDGNLDPDDLGDYITCYFSEPPCPGADFNGDSNIDPDDLGDFITSYFTGC